MMRPRSWPAALLLLLAMCRAPEPAGPAAVATGPPCHDAKPMADRGIGGTGIGAGTRLADRGIGGTGIVGVVTGFGSICVNGLEIAVDAAARISVDGRPARLADLRLAHVVAVTAGGAAAALRARSVAAWHEVSGPIDTVAADGRRLVVAGQPVRRDAGTIGPADLRPGEWVAVSGMRDLSGTIRATRLDRRAPGTVVLAGEVRRDLGVWHIGALPLRFAQAPPPAGIPVLLSGTLRGNTLRVATVARQPGAPDEGGVSRLVIEGFVDTAGGMLRMSGIVGARVGPDFGSPPPPDDPTVVEFVITAPAQLVALRWHPATAPPHAAGAGQQGQQAAPASTPAPATTSSAPAATAATSSAPAAAAAISSAPAAAAGAAGSAGNAGGQASQASQGGQGGQNGQGGQGGGQSAGAPSGNGAPAGESGPSTGVGVGAGAGSGSGSGVGVSVGAGIGVGTGIGVGIGIGGGVGIGVGGANGRGHSDGNGNGNGTAGVSGGHGHGGGH